MRRHESFRDGYIGAVRKGFLTAHKVRKIVDVYTIPSIYLTSNLNPTVCSIRLPCCSGSGVGMVELPLHTPNIMPITGLYRLFL